MLRPTVLFASALALTANAFLVPLEVADKAIEAGANHRVNHALGKIQTIELDCSTCPFAQATEKGILWTSTGPKTNLEMTFSVDDNHLTLNGAPFYPASINNIMHPLKASQVLQGAEMSKQEKAFKSDLGLSYSLEVGEEKQDGGDSVFSVTIQVLGLEGQMVNVDAVCVSVIKTFDGKLLIAKVETAPRTPNPYAEKCTDIMCRVRAIIQVKMQAVRLAALKAAEKLKKIKGGCMRKLGFVQKIKGPHLVGGPNKFQAHRHHGHHGVGMVLHSIKRVFKHILLPVLIGLVAGMAASAIGMLVGQVIVLLWMRYRRNRSPAYQPVEQVEEARASQDRPPKYEEINGLEVNIPTDEKRELLD